jgi:hypothetical protein
MKITPRQAACIWDRFICQNMGNKGKARLALLNYFTVKDIGDIDRIHASNYIHDIPSEDRMSVGFFSMQKLEKDWGMREVESEENN